MPPSPLATPATDPSVGAAFAADEAAACPFVQGFFPGIGRVELLGAGAIGPGPVFVGTPALLPTPLFPFAGLAPVRLGQGCGRNGPLVSLLGFIILPQHIYVELSVYKLLFTICRCGSPRSSRTSTSP